MKTLLRKYFKKVAALFLLILTSFSIYAYYKLSKAPDCFVADQPYKLSSKVINNTTYSLYVVISGFQEKSQVFYLFEEPVSFDDCGYVEQNPIAFSTPDLSGEIRSIKAIEVKGVDTLSFKYSENVASALEDINVRWLKP